MKKLICLFCFVSLMTVLSGQRSIDGLFDKYSGKEGYVCLTLSGSLLKLAGTDNCIVNGSSLSADIREIRLLVRDKKEPGDEDFFKSLFKGINTRDYEELVRVRESGQDIRVLIKPEGNRVSELLLLAGGKDNFLVQIKGSMTMKEARRLSEEVKMKIN